MTVLRIVLAAALLLAATALGAAQDEPFLAFRRQLDEAAGGQAGASGDHILSFASHVVVEPDASVAVTEAIAVNVTGGGEIRRGILRDFPTRYKDARGFAVRIGFSVLSVSRDGRPEPFALEAIDNGTRIRIGSKDVLIPPGRVLYEIRYRATRELGFFDGFDELYWNVTGTGWTMPIDMAGILVDLPAGATVLKSAGYTGYDGAQGHAFTTMPVPAGRFAARTTVPLSSHQGFTVAVSWPKGLVAPPGGATKALWFLQDNAPALVVWLGLVLIGGYFYRAWDRVGRDPPAGVIVPLFRPPEGMTAAAVRYVREQAFDGKAFSAAVIGLAVQGYMRIVDSAGKYRFVPQDKDPAPLSTGEKRLLAALGPFPVEVRNTNYKLIGGAREALSKALSDEYGGVAFVLNRGRFVLGAALSIAVIGLALLLASAEIEGALVAAIVLVVWWGVIAVMGRMFGSAFASARGLRRIGGLFGLVFLVPFVLVGLGLPFVLYQMENVLPAIIVAASGAAALAVMNIAFYILLPAPTAAGRALLDRIEGFRMYLATTEEERLNLLNPPTRTPDLFERYLPFAVALGCAHEWSAMFTGVLAAAGVSQPAWYSGSGWNAAHPARFADGLGSGLASSTSSASSPPGSSSGSGGGGSSGGGGGGGGGSGW